MTIAHFYCAALSFLLGVLFTSFVPLTLPFLTTVCVIAGALLVLVHVTKPEGVNWFFFWLGLGLLFFSLGGMRVEQSVYTLNQTMLHEAVGTEVVLEGLVREEPVQSETATTLYVTLSDTTLLVRTDVYADVQYGDLIRVTGTLTRPEDFETDLGRTFAYTKYLAARGVLYQVEFAGVEVVAAGEGNPAIHHLLAFKKTFLGSVYGVLPEPAAGLAAGLVLGVKGALGEELETIFRQAGIIHIVVLSGYNVMLVVIFVMFLLKYFLNKRWRLWVGLVAILLFALLVGLSATVVRASVMAALLLLMDTLGRTYIILRGLLVAAIGMLLLNPLLLAFDIGFQLSFLATLGLILIAPWFETKLAKVPNPFEVRNFLVATIATQLAVLPLLLFQIGEVSLVSVVVNVLVLPLVPVAMLLTLLVGLAGLWLPSLATLFGFGAYAILAYIIGIATWFSGLPFAAAAVPSFPWWVMVLLYVGGGVWYWRRQVRVGVLPVSDAVADWEIVEEVELVPVVVQSKTKAGESQEDSPATIPIFFR